jgi:16S rRNA (adenine1518-N6/adenine1519-N6)-dimethyltransferase
VSNLPYSKSRDAIEWLAQTSFSHGVIMVQKEFADKLLAKSSKKRKAVSIVANYAFEIQKISKVGKNNFSPPPKVDSVILKITKKNTMNKDLIQTINKIFSYRRKTIKNILKQFNKETVMNKRIDDLSGDEIIHLANQILEK